MTAAQRKFADEYVRTRNATQAYKFAYPNVKSEDTACTNGCRMLRNACVKDYIDQRVKEISDSTIADAAEIMRFYTKVMRGELGDVTVDNRGEEHQVPVKMTDRNTAAKQLAKMLGIENRIDLERLELDKAKAESGGDQDAKIVIVDDV